MFRLAVIVIIGLAFFSSCASGASASHSSAISRQSAIEGRGEIGETIIGLSSAEGDHLMLGVSPSHKLRVRNAGPILMSLGHEQLVMGLVGLTADRQVALRIAQKFVLDYFAETNEDIPVGMLAMKLADEVYQRSKSPASAPLVFNAALLGRSFSEGDKGTKLLKVDQSAGFFECKASIAMGYGAPALNSWLQKQYQGSPAEDLKALVKRAMECLQEVGAGTMEGKVICYELCVMTAGGNRLGPVAVSHTSLSANDDNNLNNADVDSLLSLLRRAT